MNILLLGSGGREHALAWKMAQSKQCTQLFIAPGNAGTLQYGINIDIGVNDFEAIKKFVIENDVEMVVVGPEEPLVKGIYDFFINDDAVKHIKLIAPSANGAQLEGSKAFSKKFMQRNAIPTAAYAEFTKESFEDGKQYIKQHTLPVVLKADGLAAGKGVVIAQTTEDALSAFEEMIINEQFGEASSKVVIEEYLDGIELSVFVLTNGKDYKITGHAKDYKRIGVGDAGLNTGGMGCVSPLPFVDDAFMKKIETKIIQPTIQGLQNENIIYNGFIFFGLIRVGEEPFLIEYNCRMGDPETEVVMPRLKNDLVELFQSMYNNTLKDVVVEFDERACATIVAVSKGYPGEYQKGMVMDFDVNDDNDVSIQSSSQIFKADDNNDAANQSTSSSASFQLLASSFVFHAGTKLNDNGDVVTNGGRVLAVTSFGETISDAVDQSKKTLNNIYFEGMYFRNDIGYEFEQ